MALPHLAGALHTFSNVTKQDNYKEEEADLIKLSKLQEQVLYLDLTWKKIVKFLNENPEKSKMKSVKEDLKDILHAAEQIENYQSNCPFQKRRLDRKEEDKKMSRASDRFKGLR
ncbi:PREDICTED: activating signal cointegrator 1 complex subunit 3-like [Galeopterus variegatus]|uniref:Activating signal cointegrator 1 complex subunit 3-like n=1 Tax=Galeopterus variegatus TaxID=482537 RepID=A0ABM0RTM8_GALVR|nr:PREDICTED: activating signal cointegrator 1 complex subunit 3-like [Galeopterus variegatus]